MATPLNAQTFQVSVARPTGQTCNMYDSPEGLAKILRSRRWQLGEALLASIADWVKYSRRVQGAEARREFVRLEMLSFVDYLATYIERGDTNYRDLYIGEKLKQ